MVAYDLGNGYLFSDGIYPTKIKLEDLPETFVYGRFYKHWSYLDVSGIKDLYYKKSEWTEDSFKYDFLYISYDSPIDVESILKYEYNSYDFSCSGHEIFTVIERILELDEYKDTILFEKATNIKEQLDKKIEEIKNHNIKK